MQTETLESNSGPITNNEIQNAINRWAHLVPSEDVITQQVNAALIDVITYIDSNIHIQKMEALVNLICSPNTPKEYAHYVSTVFSSIDFSVILSDIPHKYDRMLASIGSDRGGGGGTCANVYWQRYNSGFYDPCVPVDDEF